MARADFLTPIHKAIRSMIYELGKQLQTTDFTDQHATEVMVSKGIVQLDKRVNRYMSLLRSRSNSDSE